MSAMSGARSTTFGLARHVPRVALDWVADTPDERWKVVDGSMVFADISGFTALSERLATRGRIGAEELVETLSRVFGAMLETAATRGGQLLKFGGDALLFLFTGDSHAEQACATAVEMRSELRRASETRTSVGKLDLKISTGAHVGQFHLMLVGAPHRELVVLGPDTTTAVACENAANAGEIVVSDEMAATLPRGSVKRRDDGRLLLRWRTAPVAPSGRLPTRDTDAAAAHELMPKILADVLEGARPDPAHRVATISFMRFSGTDQILEEQGPDALADRLHETLRIAQEAFIAEDVALLCVDCDVGAGKIFCSSGVPLTSEDDEGRMLRAARAILAADPPLPLQIGINRGHVFAAEVGIPYRAAFSAMGDTTNTAARICGKAPQGTIYVHPSVLDHTRTLYESEPVGPFVFKGKAQSQILYAVGDETGLRTTVDLDDLVLLGRHDALASLTSSLDRLREGIGGVTVVSGGVGVGKSRVVHEALAAHPAFPQLAVHAEPYGAANAYRVFRDPLRSLLGVVRGPQHEMATAVREAVRRLAPTLEPYLPLVADVLQIDVPVTPEVQAILPQYRPERTADTIVELLAAVVDGPLVVSVEDAHWVDDASRVLLGRVEAETAVRPWSLIVVRRDDDGGFEPSSGTRIELDVLPAEVIRSLAVAATEAAPLRPHELDQVVARSAGNPLFLLELIRAAQELGSLDAVPTSLQGTMAAQVDALDPFAKRVLSYASVLGRSFRRSALAEVLRAEQLRVDDATIERLTRFLDEDGPDRFRFRNGLVCDVAYDGLGFNLRARLHREAGAAIERISADLGADSTMLSLHYAQAGDHERTRRFGTMAAERAARAHANADAAVQFERVIEASRRLADVDRREMCRLWTSLGEARERAGLFEAALDAYQRALSLVEDEAPERAELHLRRAATRERMGKFSLALRESTHAKSALRSRPDMASARIRARATAFAALMRQRQVRIAEADRLARAAVVEAEASDERSALAGAYRVISVAAHYQGDPEAETYCQRAYDLYVEIGDLIGQGNMAMNLGAFAFFDGRWAETLELYGQSSEASRRVGDHVEAASVDANIAEVLVSQGHLDEAEALLRNGIRVLRSSGSPWLASFAEMQLGRVHTARGRHEEAEHVFRGLIAESYEMGVPASAYEVTIHLAECLVADGRPEDALEALAEAASRTGEDMSVFDGAVALMRGRALLRLGRADDAAVEIRRGASTARHRKLEFDLARLLVLARDPALGGLAEELSDDVEAEVGEIAARLGVVTLALPAGSA
jgi:class 3 adenylate cyclase/predicted ATPase